MLTPSPMSLPSRGIVSASSGGAYRGGWITGRRYGLGQTVGSDSTDPSSLPISGPLYDPTTLTPATFPASSNTLATILGSPVIAGAAKTAETIALQQTNPLYQLQKQAISTPGTYYRYGPGGTVIASGGAPATAGAFTTGTMGSLLPMLLIGGLVVMMMARR